MTGIDLRLALPAAAAWILTIALVGLPVHARFVAVTLWVVAGVLCALWLSRLAVIGSRGWIPPLAVALAAAALCATSIAALHGTRSPALLEEAADSRRHISAIATLSQTVGPATDHFDATIIDVGGQPLRVPVVVFRAVAEHRIPLGATVAIGGTLARTDAGDHASFLFFARGSPEMLDRPPSWLGWADSLRETFLLVTAGLPGNGGALLAGLAIGDTTAVDDRLDSAMKESALSHLTAVSGANCAIVVGLIMLVGAAAGVPRWMRVVASLFALIGFVVLVTPEPSVLRAAVMAAIVLGALASGRPVRGLPVLAAATLGLLVLDPWLSREFGFALSVLATAGLLLLAGPLTAFLARFLPRALAAALSIPLAAQLACQPVLVLLDASLPTYGVIANLLAAPAAPVATVLGLVACVLSPLVPALGTATAWVAWVPSTWIAGVATFFAGLPLARLPWPDGIGGAALLAILTAVSVIAVFGTGRVQRWTALGACLALATYAGVVGGGTLSDRLGRPSWHIAGCEVGQGDAFLVRSAGQVALIDTGADPDLLEACLAEAGVDRIHLLVLSHFDHDHVGGVDAVLGRVDSAIVGPSSSPSDDQLLRELRESGAAVHAVSTGTSGVLGELRWRVLWPAERLAGFAPGNDTSVVVEFRAAGHCETGCLSSVFLGDLGAEAQARLLRSGAIDPVDVVKVSHHGSADQDDRLYLQVRATVGLIGVGENDYGHPHPRLLDLLAAAGTTAHRTDRDGLTLVAPGDSPGSVIVWTQR